MHLLAGGLYGGVGRRRLGLRHQCLAVRVVDFLLRHQAGALLGDVV